MFTVFLNFLHYGKFFIEITYRYMWLSLWISFWYNMGCIVHWLWYVGIRTTGLRNAALRHKAFFTYGYCAARLRKDNLSMSAFMENIELLISNLLKGQSTRCRWTDSCPTKHFGKKLSPLSRKTAQESDCCSTTWTGLRSSGVTVQFYMCENVLD